MVAYACKPSTWKTKEEDHHELETILGYIVRSRSALATE